MCFGGPGRGGEKLAGLRLPPRPPGAEPRPERLQKDWAGILGLRKMELDLSSATPFQRAVWKKVREIPWGGTRSYGRVARDLGRPGAARAVGGALRRNPIPLLIPCHRVIRADGSAGGFSAGREWKEFLIKFEGENRERGAGSGGLAKSA